MSDVFPLLVLMADTKRQMPIKPKNNPSGSDLNHPIKPLRIIGNETANIKDAIRPAVVPPITRTSAKTTMHVNEPITSGNIIVKS